MPAAPYCVRKSNYFNFSFWNFSTSNFHSTALDINSAFRFQREVSRCIFTSLMQPVYLQSYACETFECKAFFYVEHCDFLRDYFVTIVMAPVERAMFQNKLGALLSEE